MMGLALRQAQGKMENYGLPTPDHKLGEAHPTISSDLLPRIGHGRIRVKPNVQRIDGKRVLFVDGTSVDIDTIVWCTGYKITFPFLASDVIETTGNQVALYRRVVHPQRPNLYFIGLVQPLGAIMPIAELQSEWVADLLQGRAALPDVRRHAARRSSASSGPCASATWPPPRHTIQVDFDPYMRLLRRERKRTEGVSRALPRRSRELAAA